MAEPAISCSGQAPANSGATHSKIEEIPVPRVSTLLNLVQIVQDYASSDDEVVAVIIHLLETRRVVLGGIFAGEQIRMAA